MKLAVRKRSSFSLGFGLVPAHQRQAMDTLYTFCRLIDDAVDEAANSQEAQANLAAWRAWMEQPEDPQAPPLVAELRDLSHGYGVLWSDLLWILSGVEMDLTQQRYQSFDELLTYCDGVASAVGLCLLAIWGVERQQGYDYAIYTGRALQLTNIIRDVSQDMALGRVYLPQDELEKFGYSEQDLREQSINAHFFKLMAHQIAQAKVFYTLSQEALTHLPHRKLLPGELMRHLYLKVLQRIERDPSRVFRGKTRLSLAAKLAALCRAYGRYLVHRSS